MKNVGLYVRVSTQEQAESGWSIEGQVAELYKFCDAHGDWKVRWVLKDPGYTAAILADLGMDAANVPDSIKNAIEFLVEGPEAWVGDRLAEWVIPKIGNLICGCERPNR